MILSGSPNPLRVLPGWSYFGPRFFPFFRLLLSLGFFSRSADGGWNCLMRCGFLACLTLLLTVQSPVAALLSAAVFLQVFVVAV
jgi:hypothetical protein